MKPRSFGLFSLAALLLAGRASAAPFATSTPLQAVVDKAVSATLEQFSAIKLQSNQLAVTLVDLRDLAHPVQAGFHADEQIYPASVVKLFYLAAAHRWMEDGKLADTPELRRALRDMIVSRGDQNRTNCVVSKTGISLSAPPVFEEGERSEARRKDGWCGQAPR